MNIVNKYHKDLIEQLIKDEYPGPDFFDKILAEGESIAPILVELVKEDAEQPDVNGYLAVERSVTLLGKLKYTEAIEALLDLLEGTTPQEMLQDHIMENLKEFGTTLVEPVMERLPKADNWDTKGNFLIILSKTGTKDERIFQGIVEFLDEDLALGSYCFRNLGDPRALPFLSKKFDDLEVEEAGVLFANQDFFELEDVITHLGGSFSAEQLKKLEKIRAQRSDYSSLLENLIDVSQKNISGSDILAQNLSSLLTNPQQKDKDPEEESYELPEKPVKKQAIPKIKRNQPCWCKSGKKYKKCHLKKDKGVHR